MDVEVLSPEAQNVNVSVKVAPGENHTFEEVEPLVEQAVTALFNGHLLGKPLLLAELGNRIYAVEGVENYQILSPTADVTGDKGTLPLLGTLTVTEMGA